MKESLSDKVVKGAIWSGIERFGYLGIQFIANLVMARLLMPSDFGIIGILLIFTTLANVLADSGLGSALIQRNELTKLDCSTIFFTNIILGSLLYCLLYLSAPFINEFFNYDNLTLYLRIISIIIIIDAFGSIQNSILIKSLEFKKIAIVKILSALGACSLSIILALHGYGVWSLILQYIVYSIFRSIGLYCISKWRPSFDFSIISLKSLFGYGSKLMLSSIIAEIYLNFQTLLIGKFLNPRVLGFYTQAKQLQQVPVAALTTIINQVTFPAFSKIQDDLERFKRAFKNNLVLLSFINFPLMFLLSAIAHPLIAFLYTDKWLPSVPYFQFLCLGFGTLLAIHNTNLTALKALGKSGDVLKLEILKKVIGCCLLLAGIVYWGIWGIMIALTINSVIELFLNGYYINRNINFSVLSQIRLLIPFLMFSTISFGITISFLHIIDAPNICKIIIGIIIFILCYGTQIFFFKKASFKEIILPILRRVNF